MTGASHLSDEILEGWELAKSDLKGGVSIMLGARRRALRCGDHNNALGALVAAVRVYRTAEDFETARRFQRRVVKEAPSPSAYWMLGNIAAELSLRAKLLGEPRAAIRHLRLAARHFDEAARMAQREGDEKSQQEYAGWVKWAEREIESMRG